MKIFEVEIPRKTWHTIVSRADKQELGDQLIDLVRNAYQETRYGSFVNSIRDVLPSDWEVYDWDSDPGIDVAVFYRKARSNEPWQGMKIQGIGHDGQAESKREVIRHLLEMLQQSGTWIEASGKIRAILISKSAPIVTDQETLRKLFDDPELKMLDRNTYQRKLPDGTVIKQSVFGRPKI